MNIKHNQRVGGFLFLCPVLPRQRVGPTKWFVKHSCGGISALNPLLVTPHTKLCPACCLGLDKTDSVLSGAGH